MGTDGLRSTRPVEYPVGLPKEAEAMFDVLTYQKGAAVLRMLEQYLGPEPFRQGIAGYLSELIPVNLLRIASMWRGQSTVFHIDFALDHFIELVR